MVCDVSLVCSGRQHQVPGLGCSERRSHGLGVAHLAYQDHIGILTQHGAHRLREAGRVMPTSICSTIELRLSCWYSMGSSMVMM